MNKLTAESTLSLPDGTLIPQLGFGVYQLTDPEECKQAVKSALDIGYRHFDTASAYKNEEMLGDVFKEHGVSRDELYITTKCWISDFGKTKTRQSLEKSLRDLQMEYVDLYLLHWPEDSSMMEAWESMVEMQAEGKIKSIGVSNFSISRFEDFFFQHTDVVPAINQVESHPKLRQSKLQTYCKTKDIILEAYSPLGRGNKEILEDPALKEIAASTGKSTAQVILRWHLQQGRVVIPKSANPVRIQENFDLFDFRLSDEQLTVMDELDEDKSVLSWLPNDGIGWY